VARLAVWAALAVPPAVLVLAVHGLDVDLATALADRQFVLEQAATLATALVAAAAAFDSIIPGRRRQWYWLILIPLAVWLATVGAGCINDARTLGWQAFQLRFDSACLLPMVLVGLVPATTMVSMLRRGAPLYPRLTLVLGAVATAGVVNFALRLFHVGDISLMVLVWHVGLVAVLSLAASMFAPRFLGWARLFDRSQDSPRSR
jgi:hypothetical protein